MGEKEFGQIYLRNPGLEAVMQIPLLQDFSGLLIS